jgi:hypothetical protein
VNFKKLKKTFINKQFQRLILEKEDFRVVSLKEIKTVGILCSDEVSKWIPVKEEVEKVLNLRNAKIYSFRKFNKNDAVSFKHFSEKDFTWKGEVTQPNFKSFLDEPFDLLIGFFNKNNLFIENAVLRSNAKFKVGLSNVNQKLYDMEIAEYPKNIDKFLIELKRYLLILKKLKN